MFIGKIKQLAFVTRRRGLARFGQRGAVMVMVAVSILALFAFAVLAIDGAILMTTKTQLQNAADAAALAGVSGLAFSQAEATARAIAIAGENVAVKESLEPVVITAADVIFPTDTRIQVTTHRTVATGDPLRAYFLKIVGRPNLTDVTAVASAELVNLCATDCLKPWAIPDRWDDANGNGEYDGGDTYTDSNGNDLFDIGEPYTDDDGNGGYTPPEFYDPLLTGYLAPGDVGFAITLKAGNPQQALEPGHYFPVDMPPLGGEQSPLTGGAWYREWIRVCAPYVVNVGDSLQVEPGNMVGPTIQGMNDLIDLDPDAYWNSSTNQIAGSIWGKSPRVGLIPFMDPTQEFEQGREVVHVVKIAAFFLESTGPGSRVNGRFMKVSVQGIPCEDQGTPSFIVGMHLVQ